MLLLRFSPNLAPTFFTNYKSGVYPSLSGGIRQSMLTKIQPKWQNYEKVR